MNALENKQQLKKKHENKLAQDVIVQDTIEVGAKKNAVAWVQDAVVAGFSQFNLFKEPGKQEDTTAHQDHHCKNRLKESLSLAEKLSYSEFQANGSFKYLENSLKKGLKAVNCWLDDLIKNRCEASEKVKELRKKLHQFLLKHIESATGETM
ncbi:hypothetical protein IGI04_022142 [Brassica rapa subsp. trilocularis]|uniref:DUF6857 domain-containing protein n=1 Tax=Brassica rapa subsp. trilocularis TaxID=1813537 RepID=A0ABQ7M057_BRACM|nr:hypothetical protein IGI04_022142 [Brassica rapa subsp. trilocularis]